MSSSEGLVGGQSLKTKTKNKKHRGKWRSTKEDSRFRSKQKQIKMKIKPVKSGDQLKRTVVSARFCPAALAVGQNICTVNFFVFLLLTENFAPQRLL